MVDRIKRAIHGEHGLRSATVLLAITLFLSNVLGLVRDVLLASRSHGLGQLDPYYAAFRLPDLIFNLLVLGAITSAFIPVYAEALKIKGKDTAIAIANNLLGNLLLVVTIGIAILWIFMPAIVPHLVTNFTPEKQQLTTHMARIMLLSPLFFCLSYVSGGVLNAHKRFFSYSVAPLVYNVSIIVGALLLPRYGIVAVAWSVVIGSLLHFLTQVPTLLSIGFSFAPRVDWKNSYVRKILKLMIPRTAALGLAQVVLLFFTFIAGRMSSGALTIFSLSNDFQTTPAILFGASLATAVFPSLSEAAAEKSYEHYHSYLHRTLRISFFLLIPLTVLTYILRAQITRLYVGLGHNTNWDDTIRTINTIAWFTFSFLGQGIVFIMARAFYAIQDTKRPMFAAIIGAIVTLAFAFVLPKMPYFSYIMRNDVAALAAAYSIGIWVQAILMIFWLPKRWKGSWRWLWRGVVPIVSMSIIAGALTWVTLRIIGEGLHIDQVISVNVGGLGNRTVLKLLFQGAIAGLVGTVSYLLMSKFVGMEELGWFLKRKHK